MRSVKNTVSYQLVEVDDSESEGWSKMTVDYVVKNRSKIKKTILNTARRYRKSIQHDDVDDIYDDVIEYLYKADDYNINKAINKSKTGEMASLEGYVGSCVKFVTIRACSELNDHSKKVISENTTGKDGSELSLFDSMYDPKSSIGVDDFDYDLRTICKSCEPIRYRFGPDIYLVWFVRLMTITKNCRDKFGTIMDILGISDRELMKLKNDYENNTMSDIAKAITLQSINESISILREYIYSADSICEAINAI